MNNTYIPKSRPTFWGDDWAELRDRMYDEQGVTMSRVAGMVADMYQRSAVVLSQQSDPIAQALRAEPNFDLRCIMLAHAHLAAFWRYTRDYRDDRLAGTTNLTRIVEEWREWVYLEATLWILDAPMIVHKMGRLLALWQTSDVLVSELELWDELKSFYPLPPPANGDFFDDQSAYTPYSNG